MCGNTKGFFKRMLPFLATFAVGVFIASFFVTISGPNFRGRGFGGRHKEMKRLRMENEQLRNENLRLKNQLENENWTVTEMPVPAHEEFKSQHKNLGPEWPVEGPPPPPRPARVHK
jgi:hypothetical protein